MQEADTYASPFSWRYGSQGMRNLWSEGEKRKRWRQIWIALAEAQLKAGLVSEEQIADLRAHAHQIDVMRAMEIEAEIKHDVMAEIRTFAEQCPVGGGIIHLGATSMDVTDNAEALRQRDALDMILQAIANLLSVFADRLDRWAGTTCIGWTHLQPAEPTTVGYRLATYAQDLATDYVDLSRIRADLKGKGIKGAVGSGASYVELLVDTGMTSAELEQHVMNSLGLAAFEIAGQTYPRRQDFVLLSALASLAGTLYRFAFDLRLLQSPAYGEWAEPFSPKQVGSSAMPFKRNPINAEKIDSLGRLVAAMPSVAWNNFAHTLLERTLDDSANRRVILPEAFLIVDEMLSTALNLLNGLTLNEMTIVSNMERYGVFSATERLLMALGRAGADRQVMHERIREHSLKAWAALQRGEVNPLIELLCDDDSITSVIPSYQVRKLMDASKYVGDAPERARSLAGKCRELADVDSMITTP
jgi:adenylosuccinate lyase